MKLFRGASNLYLPARPRGGQCNPGLEVPAELRSGNPTSYLPARLRNAGCNPYPHVLSKLRGCDNNPQLPSRLRSGGCHPYLRATLAAMAYRSCLLIFTRRLQSLLRTLASQSGRGDACAASVAMRVELVNISVGQIIYGLDGKVLLPGTVRFSCLENLPCQVEFLLHQLRKRLRRARMPGRRHQCAFASFQESYDFMRSSTPRNFVPNASGAKIFSL